MSLREPTLIKEFFDTPTCEQVRAAMDRGVVEAAEILESGIVLDEEARRATSINVDAPTLRAVEGRLDAVRDELSARCRIPLHAREGAGFIRYSAGGFYRPHRDRGEDDGWPAAAARRIAVVVFLNSASDGLNPWDFVGGELVIHHDQRGDAGRPPIRILPRAGMLVAFDAASLHEVRPVVQGTRDVVVDWFYGPEA
jgi:predicted 2-oxoglutarate/Fe(II)-dependent dioxygenase YbiX